MIPFAVAAVWCLATVAASQLALPWPLVGLAGAAFAGGCLLARRAPEFWLAVAITALALTAMLRYEASLPRPAEDGVAGFNDGAAVVLRGMVENEPEQRERSQLLRIKVDAFRDGDGIWLPMDGRVLATVRLFPEYAYGDYVEMEGKVVTPEPFDGFDYRTYLLRRGVESVSLFPSVRRTGAGGGSDLTRRLNGLREELASGIEAAMPEPEAGLASGIFLGKRSAIPEDVNDDFKRSGLAHLIAISGGNIALVAGMVIACFLPLVGRRPATGIAALVVLIYAVLVGFTPSVLRATPMAFAAYGAEVAGRPGRGFQALVMVAGGMLAFSPTLIDDVSFQLSVFATGGIVLASNQVAGGIGRALRAVLPAGAATWLAEQLAVTVSATVAVLPILAVHFHEVSLVSIPANLLAGPVFAAVLASAAFTAVFGSLSPELAQVFGEAASLPISFLIAIARFSSDLPFASVSLPGLSGWVLMAFIAGFGWLFMRKAQRVEDAENRLKVSRTLQLAAALSLIAAALSIDIFTPGDGRLQVTFLDVGQGDAILIETPDGRVVLVDGGPSVSRLLNELGEALPAAERRIDLVVLTHAQDDHVAGLAGIFDRYEIGMALAGPREGSVGSYRAWREGLIEQNVPLAEAAAHHVADLGSGIRLEVLWPGEATTSEDLNENSVVLRLVYGDVSVLLTGDLGFEGEEALLDSGVYLRSSVLKIGHHGSDGSTSPAFLDAVAPGLAVISAGEDNSFGHPSPTTRLRLAGIPTLRTDINGRVTLKTDGRRLWLDTQKGTAEIVTPHQAQN